MAIEVKQKFILIIVDGFGIAEHSKGNAITSAQTPNWDYLTRTYPHVAVHASGNHVGLPEGVMGNSEVGHLTIGTGRITFQSLERINQSIRKGTLATKEEIQLIKNHLAANSGILHLMGLLSDGQVHSDQKHLHALIDIFADQAEHIYVHGFTDGRDTPVDSSVGYIAELTDHISQYDNVSLASIIGRYYAMDRDNKMDRTKIAFDCLTKRTGEKTDDVIKTIKQRYEEDETDEFLKPIVVEEEAAISSGDTVLFFNFRPDRARQITKAFNYDVDFDTPQLDHFLFVTMTKYDDDWDLPVLFETKKIRNSLAEILSDNGLRQSHIAETEKYAHVTYFLNGGIEDPFKGEDRVLIPSPKIATYDLKPEMSTPGIVEEAVKTITSDNYPFIVINIACPDMVGHTGVLPATITAVEATDDAFGEIYSAGKEHGYQLVITADHGNAEKMLDGDQVHTAHTTNKVPFLITNPAIHLQEDGGLKNIAPTILHLMGVPIPEDMDGGILLR